MRLKKPSARRMLKSSSRNEFVIRTHLTSNVAQMHYLRSKQTKTNHKEEQTPRKHNQNAHQNDKTYLKEKRKIGISVCKQIEPCAKYGEPNLDHVQRRRKEFYQIWIIISLASESRITENIHDVTNHTCHFRHDRIFLTVHS